MTTQRVTIKSSRILLILLLLLTQAYSSSITSQNNRAQIVINQREITLSETAEHTNRIEELISESYLLSTTDLDAAQICADSALIVADSLNMLKPKGEALRAIANIHLLNGKKREAIETYYQAINISRIAKDSMNIAKCISNIGLTYHDGLDFKRSKEFFSKAAPYFMELGDNYTLSAIYYNLMIAEFSMGNYYKAMSMNDKSLFYAKQSQSARREGDCYMAQGMIYLALKDSIEGTRKIEKAIHFFRDKGINDQISAAYTELAWDFNTRELYSKSNAALYSAIENNANAMESPQAIRICQLFSENYLNLGNYDEAIKYLNLALEASNRHDNIVGQGITLSKMGDIYLQSKEYDKAVDLYLRAKDALLKGDQLPLHWQQYNNIARIQLHKKNFSKAIEIAIKSYEYGIKENSIEILSESATILEDAYYSTNQLKKAYQFAKIGEIYRDSLDHFNQEKIIENLHLNFDFSERLKEEKHNQYLAQITYNEEIKRQKATIIFFIIIAIVAIILAFYFIRNNESKRKTIILLNQLHQESIIQKKKISQQNKELQRYQDHLEETVRARTQELFITKEQAIESERLKISFMRKITHELRTPLNAVVGFSDILAEEANEELAHFRSVIQENNNKILVVLEDLNNLVVTNSSSDFANIINFRISELFNELEQMYPQRLSGLRLIFRYSEEDFFINQSKRKIKQILTILINNALSFTDSGKIIVKATKLGEEVLFEVEDQGIGIPEDKIEMIFEEGYKVDNTTPGKGIGLYIGRKIAESLNGKIMVESKVGEGSKFFIHIPNSDKHLETLPEE
ncbi:MAG: ATP-binding protein [Bacteroidales bacterium]